jgi:hypothetical protein
MSGFSFQPLLPASADLLAGGASTAGYIKVWTGASFEKKPVKVYNGATWDVKPVKYYNGSIWVQTT